MVRCPVDGCSKSFVNEHGVGVHCRRMHKGFNVENAVLKQSSSNSKNSSKKRILAADFKNDIVSVFGELKSETLTNNQLAETLFKKSKYSKSSLNYLKNKIPQFIRDKCGTDIVKTGFSTFRLNFRPEKIESNILTNVIETPISEIDQPLTETAFFRNEIDRLKRAATRQQEFTLQMLRLMSVYVASPVE